MTFWGTKQQTPTWQKGVVQEGRWTPPYTFFISNTEAGSSLPRCYLCYLWSSAESSFCRNSLCGNIKTNMSKNVHIICTLLGLQIILTLFSSFCGKQYFQQNKIAHTTQSDAVLIDGLESDWLVLVSQGHARARSPA